MKKYKEPNKMTNKTQREVILECLRYCRHRFLNHPFSGIHKTGLNCNQLDKVIDDVKNYRAEFGTMSFTTCSHDKGYYYMTFWGKEMFYCPTCLKKFKGRFMRVLLTK